MIYYDYIKPLFKPYPKGLLNFKISMTLTLSKIIGLIDHPQDPLQGSVISNKYFFYN